MENPNTTTFHLLSPSFSVFFFLHSFQSLSLLTESQSGVSLSFIFLFVLKQFLCFCLIHADIYTSLHCTAVCSRTTTACWCQCVASLCWWFLSWTYTPRAAVLTLSGAWGTPCKTCILSWQFGSFLLLPTLIISIFLCLLLSLQSGNIFYLVNLI